MIYFENILKKIIPYFPGVLFLFTGFTSLLYAQKEPVRFGIATGTAFYQPRIRLHQNLPNPGFEFRGSALTGDGGEGNFIFEFGYMVSRIQEVRSFYSHRSGMNIRDAECVNMHHYMTFSGTWKHDLFEEETVSLLVGLQVNWLFRNNSFCRYLVDSTRQVEWQGPFNLSARDRFYPVLTTGVSTRLLKTEKAKIYLYVNAFHQLFAFTPGGGKTYKDPLLSSRYLAPFMGFNAGLRLYLQ